MLTKAYFTQNPIQYFKLRVSGQLLPTCTRGFPLPPIVYDVARVARAPDFCESPHLPFKRRYSLLLRQLSQATHYYT